MSSGQVTLNSLSRQIWPQQAHLDLTKFCDSYHESETMMSDYYWLCLWRPIYCLSEILLHCDCGWQELESESEWEWKFA